MFLSSITDAGYCYRQNSMICLPIVLSCKNGLTYWDAIWVWTRVGPRSHVFNASADHPM